MPASYYETDRATAEYLLFHYGDVRKKWPGALSKQATQNFPMRCVAEGVDARRLPKNARALDLGCAVGRATFELARHCADVVGVDYSARFIQVARRLKKDGVFAFQQTEEGALTRETAARVPVEIDRERVKFERGDAMRLRKNLGSFDVVLMANLIDRLRQPRKCLAQLPGLVKTGGQLIITSPYTWLPEYTERKNWLGGFLKQGKPWGTFEALEEILAPDFRLRGKRDWPFVIREHARKFQLGVAEASVWVRK
jgi:putative 4-mercaptohistidine N1-methyltranferase